MPIFDCFPAEETAQRLQSLVDESTLYSSCQIFCVTKLFLSGKQSAVAITQTVFGENYCEQEAFTIIKQGPSDLTYCKLTLLPTDSVFSNFLVAAC